MRRVSIVVTCDVCESEITEETEGDSAVRFTARGVERELDICDDDLYGTFLQEGRSVTNRKKRAKTDKKFACHCGKSYDTERGLTAHQTRQGHEG